MARHSPWARAPGSPETRLVGSLPLGSVPETSAGNSPPTPTPSRATLVLSTAGGSSCVQVVGCGRRVERCYMMRTRTCALPKNGIVRCVMLSATCIPLFEGGIAEGISRDFVSRHFFCSTHVPLRVCRASLTIASGGGEGRRCVCGASLCPRTLTVRVIYVSLVILERTTEHLSKGPEDVVRLPSPGLQGRICSLPPPNIWIAGLSASILSLSRAFPKRDGDDRWDERASRRVERCHGREKMLCLSGHFSSVDNRG